MNRGDIGDISRTEGREEIAYRFPYSRVALEPVPDISGTFAVRLVWQRGKTPLTLFESTALRPIAQVRLHGQNFPVFLSQHSRKRRDRILLAGKRKTARSPRSSLRFIVGVEGREDRLTWTWHVGATAAALANLPPDTETVPPDEVTLFLPLAPGQATLLTQPDLPDLVAVWLNDLVVTVRAGDAAGVREGCAPVPSLTADPRGLMLTLSGVDLSGHGTTLSWETWVSAARTEAEARLALTRHAAEARDRAQVPAAIEGAFLTRIGDESEAILMDDFRIAKRGVERQAYRVRGGDGVERQTVGEGVDTALNAVALLARYYRSGDDAVRRRARLLSYGVCDFQISIEESPHWGAIWDAHQTVGKKKEYVDSRGGKTLCIATAARAARGLHTAYGHFGTEMLERTALAASQWILLKLDRLGYIAAERFTEEGPPTEDPTSPWVMGEALVPLVETFRTTRNEVFLKAALRIINAIKEGLADASLRFESGSSEYLSAAIEGILLVSREYENPELITLARQIALALRARRAPDGSLIDPPCCPPLSPLAPTLAAARGALALSRVDEDLPWTLFALRAVRAADAVASARPDAVTLADRGALAQNAVGVLLSAATRAKNCVADWDKITITRGWQTFAPDPATRDYIQVTAADGSPVDYLALVCPVSLQVLITVLAPPTVTTVKIEKNHRTPYVKNLLNGDFDQRAELLPFGDGTEANIGVFQADT